MGNFNKALLTVVLLLFFALLLAASIHSLQAPGIGCEFNASGALQICESNHCAAAFYGDEWKFDCWH